MNVVIEIHFISADNKVLQSGSFPLKSRKPEQVALEFWNQIKRKMPFGADLEKVFCDGKDITKFVKEYFETESDN